MKWQAGPAVGVELPLLLSGSGPGSGSAKEREPFQLLLASLATRMHTPDGGMPLLPTRNGVTLGSCRYVMYVDHRWRDIALVHRPLLRDLADLLGASAGLMVLSTSPGERKRPKRSLCSLSGLSHRLKSSDAGEKRLNRDELVCVDRAVEGRLLS